MPPAREGVRNVNDRTLVAASVGQAAGTLTLHLLPLLLHLVAVAWGVSSLVAGSCAAAFSMGQLAATLTLPALAGGPRFRLLVALGGTTLSASVVSIGAASASLVTAWATAGFGSGALIVASATAVARDARPVLAFSARLAASLMIGGVGALALGLLHGRLGFRGSFELRAACARPPSCSRRRSRR